MINLYVDGTHPCVPSTVCMWRWARRPSSWVWRGKFSFSYELELLRHAASLVKVFQPRFLSPSLNWEGLKGRACPGLPCTSSIQHWLRVWGQEDGGRRRRKIYDGGSMMGGIYWRDLWEDLWWEDLWEGSMGGIYGRIYDGRICGRDLWCSTSYGVTTWSKTVLRVCRKAQGGVSGKSLGGSGAVAGLFCIRGTENEWTWTDKRMP